MSDEFDNKPTTAYWVISAVLLTWNLIGLLFYYQQSTLTPEIMADVGLSAEQIAHISGTPAWAHSGFAIAVNAGVLGAILLLLRKAWAVPLFALSLLGALVQNFDGFVLRDALGAWGTTGLILPVAIILIAIFSILYGRSAKARGWLS